MFCHSVIKNVMCELKNTDFVFKIIDFYPKCSFLFKILILFTQIIMFLIKDHGNTLFSNVMPIRTPKHQKINQKHTFFDEKH